jgi:uncharacterized protein (DUF983 family)
MIPIFITRVMPMFIIKPVVARQQKARFGSGYGATCPNCKRQHMFKYVGGKSQCAKCDWVLEDRRAYPTDWDVAE